MLMSLLFILFPASLWAAPATTELAPTVVQESPLSGVYPRSVQWPSVPEKLPERRTSPDLADTLNSTGQLQVRTQGSPTISIRGSGQSGRVLSLFNGVPLNFSTGFGAPLVLLPKEIIGEVNVVKGPSSIFYGSQALGGSVHFAPYLAKSPEARVYASDTDSSYLPGKEGGLANSNFSLILPFLKTSSGSHQASFFQETNDGQFSYEFQGKEGVRNNNQSRTTRGTVLGRQQYRDVDVSYSLVAGENRLTSPGPVNFPIKTEETTQGHLISLGPKLRINPRTSVSTRAHRIEVQSDFLSDGDASQFHQTTYIQQSDFQWNPSRWKIKIFADYFAHSLSSTFFPRDLKQDVFEAGPLVTYYLTPQLYILGGTRYLFRDREALGNAGVFYESGRNLTWLQYSEGFRRPSLSDQFADTPFSLSNPNLRPEESRQIELGYKLHPAKALITTYQWQFSGELRAFGIQYKDFFETQQASPTQVQKVNRGRGTSQGLDSKINLGWGPWVFDVSYNYLKTKNQSLNNDPFRLSPEHQLSATLTHFIGPFGVKLQNVVWNKTFDRNLAGELQPLPSWSQWNVEFFSYAFQNFNFNFGITNIFDVSKQLTLNYPEPQKRYWAQFRYAF